MSNGKIEVDEKFEKETNVVVVFKGQKMYDNDCGSLRRIIGKAFPKLLERKEKIEESMDEKFLMRKSYDGVSLIPERNLTLLENELKKYGIQLSFIHADMDMIKMIPKEINEWRYYLSTYLENDNEKIVKIYNEYTDNLISYLNINFSVNETTIKTPIGDITGNYFKIRTVSNKSEEALKLVHKRVVVALLEILEPIDEIEQISYYCGDIEHETKSRISCVLD